MQLEQLESKTKFTTTLWNPQQPNNYQAVTQLFKLNKLQLGSLFASVTLLTAGYFALPAPKAIVPTQPTKTPVVTQTVVANTQADVLATPLPISPTSLANIQQNKLLRVATINDATTYSLDGNMGADFAHGYGYDVIRRYAHKLKVDLKVITYDNEQAALAAVLAGKADIALTNTAFNHNPITSNKTTRSTIKSMSDFQKASYHPNVSLLTAKTSLAQSVTPVAVKQDVPNDKLTQLSLSCNQGFLQQYGLNTQVNWIVPSDAKDLATDAKTFLCDGKQIALNKKTAEFYRQTTLNDAYSREHFVSTMKTSLPTYRHAFEQNAKTYDHDWRLLVAMGYQESQLKPDAVSPTGVRGLMMLTNDTAKAMGVANRNDPMQSIAGGAKYMALLNKEFADVPNPDRLWFSLAAYNMGPVAVNAIQNTLNAAGKNGNSWSEVYQFLNQHASENPRYYQCLTYVAHIRGYLDALKSAESAMPATLSAV